MKPIKTSFIIILLSLIAISNTLHGQTGQVRGRLRDSKTLEPLPFANVFINLTTLGTASDPLGNYVLSNIPAGTNEIVFSFVGYKSIQKIIQLQPGEVMVLDVLLEVDEKELESVVISGSRDKEWDNQLKRFEKIFLGTTQFAKSCKILNPWVIEFKEIVMDGKNVLTASSFRPLEIENSALGYRIDYHLKSLISTSDSYTIKGEVRMEELKSADPKVIKNWNQNRNIAYEGSLRHFLKSIVEGKVIEEGFNVYTDKSGYENNPYRSAVFAVQLDKSIQTYSFKNPGIEGVTKGEFTIPIKQRLEVHYRLSNSRLKVYSDVPYPVSWIEVNGGVIKTNSNGILLNPSSLFVSGAMNEARVGDLLPTNYSQNSSELLKAPLLGSNQDIKLEQLIEKPYVQTDKPYYYQGEKIWFKAYINYSNQELMDSLSKVLYVELIGSDMLIKQTRTLPIIGGSAAGCFELPSDLSPNNYILRSYTQWMLNFNQDLIFVKSLPVLGLYERVVPLNETSLSPAHSREVKFIGTSTVFDVQERVDLDFEVKDSIGNPIATDLSVSVTNADNVVSLTDELNILQSFPIPNLTPVTLNAEPIYPIEYGISLNGQYKNKSGKSKKANLIAVQGNFKKTVSVQTDEHGKFWLTGLQFNDSTVISFQESGKKKKFEGNLTIFKRNEPTINPLAIRIPSITKVKENLLQHSIAVESRRETKVLNEVVIREQNEPINKNIIPNSYAKADFSFTGAEIVTSSRASLVNALIGRIPGLTLINGYLRIGGGSNLLSAQTTEPLIIIDGVQMTSNGTQRLYQIMPEIVDRVDVIKYGGAAIYGTRGGNGVIIVTTKSGDYASGSSLKNDTSFFTLTLNGFSTTPTFKGFNYDLSNRYEISDSGSTIFWTPQLYTDEKTGQATLSFYAGSSPAKYKITLEGVSVSGAPLRGIFFIEIKSK